MRLFFSILYDNMPVCFILLDSSLGISGMTFTVEVMLSKWTSQSRNSRWFCPTRACLQQITGKTRQNLRQSSGIRSDKCYSVMKHKSGILFGFSVFCILCVSAVYGKPLPTDSPEGSMSETKPPPEGNQLDITPSPANDTDTKPLPQENAQDRNPTLFENELEIDFGDKINFGDEIEISNIDLPTSGTNQNKKHSFVLEFKVQNLSGIVLLNRVPDDVHSDNKDAKDNKKDKSKENNNKPYDQRGAMYFAVSVVSVYGLSIGILIAVTIRKDSLEDHEVKTFLRRRRKLFRRFKRDEKRQAKMAISHALAMAQTTSLLMAVPQESLDKMERSSSIKKENKQLIDASKDQARTDITSSSV